MGRGLRAAAAGWMLALLAGMGKPAPLPASGLTLPPADANLLLVTIDTWRHDRLGFFDSRFVQTPVMDALARQSFVFSRAFAHNPVTLPSHTNILTGTTPLYHGISDNTGFRLEDRFVTLAETLRGAGFRTAAFVGSFPLDSRFGLDQGFDVYDDYYGTHNALEFFFVERTADKVIRPAQEWIAACRGRWFVWVHLFDPHQPYQPPSPYRETYRNDLYSGEVAFVDSQLGGLFDFLKRSGQMDRTVVVLTGDHGEALGEKGEETHSYFAYNNTLWVPLLLRVPGNPHRLLTENVCHVDLFPTVCDLLGLKAPAHLQGRSLRPLLEGRTLPERDIYFESLTAWLNRDWAPLRGLLRRDLKFIDLPIKEVYDISRDPQEEKNLASASPIGRLKNDLLQLQRRLKSPQAAGRSATIDPQTQRRLSALGYLAENRPVEHKREYTAADDLKTLLPLQNQLLKGTALIGSGQYAEAERLLRGVIDKSPAFLLAYQHLATMFMETGRPQRAVAVLEEGLKSNPGDLRLLSRLGIVLAENGQWKRAVEILRASVDRDQTDPDLFNHLGIALYRGGDYPAALEAYRRALALDANNASVFNNLGSLFLSRYLSRPDPASFRQAEENFRRALAIDPAQYAAYNGLGAAYRKAGRLDEAVRCWEKALEIKPDYDFPLVNLGITWLERGEGEKALSYLRRYRTACGPRLSDEERARLERLIAEAQGLLQPGRRD